MAQPNRLDGRLLFVACVLSLFRWRLVLSAGEKCTIVSVGNRSAVSEDHLYDSLQDALDFAAAQSNSNCTEILLLPGEQYYVDSPVVIDSSFTLRSIGGRAKVIMKADRPPVDDYPYDPFFSLTVWNADSVEFDGVDFWGSSGIINFQNVTNVTVSNCTFRYFSEGALDIYNCPVITVVDCVFEDNGPVAFTLKRQPFRGHSGGLSIACYNLSRAATRPAIVVNDSVFVNNSAFPSEELIQSVSDLFTDLIFTGRGGALSLMLIDPTVVPILVIVDNCTFESNVGEAFGGGVYIIFWVGTAHNATFHNCTFKRNRSGYAGGLLSAFFDSGSRKRFNFVNVSRCLFVENEAAQGGGANFLLPRLPVEGGRWSYARYEYCTFERNLATDFAAALSFGNLQVFRDRSLDRPFEIRSCTFVNNSHKASTTFGSLFVSVVFEGTTVFSGSEGSAIQLGGALMFLKGTLNITGGDTTVTNNGALYFTTYSQLQLFKGSEMYFKDNVGGIGASITTESMEDHQAFTSLLYNPLCFLLYEDYRVPPDEWTNVSIHFSHNKALAGAVGFFNSLDVCSWVQFREPFFDRKRVLNWTFVDPGNNTNSFHKNDPTNPTWYTQTETHSLEVEDDLVDLYAGEHVKLYFTALDQLGEPVASFVRLVSQNSYDNPEVILDFDPSLDLYGEINETINARMFAHHDFEGHDNSNTRLLSQTVTVKNFLQQTSAKDQFTVHPKDCPVGYTLQPVPMDDDHSACTCNAYNSEILACNGTQLSFMESLWATSTSESDDQLFVHHCPTGYCQCQLSSDSGEDTCLYFYDEQEPDNQCSCLRKGILCGECINGTGVSALLNHCVTCDDAQALLIPLLAVVDVVVLILMILLLTMPVPDWIYPCLMFLQLLPFTTESVQLGFEVTRPGLLYVACGLSFYFPFDACLYSRASPLVTYAVRFVPILADLFAFPVTMLFMCRFLKRRYLLPWHSVWLVVLLQYMHTTYSAMSILHCTDVPINYNTTELRWFVDGEVTCFTGAHLALSLTAMLVLLFCTALIAFTMMLTTSGKFSEIKWLAMLREPLLLAGFKYKWWFSAELAQRFLFILVAVCSPSSIYPLLFTTCIITTLVLYVQPYASKAANFLETVFLVSTVLFFVISVPDSFRTLGLNYIPDNGPCSVNGTSIYIFATAIYFMNVLYSVPLLTTILVVVLIIARVILRLILRQLRKAAARSAMSNKRSLRNRVYSGLVSRAGVTKTSVLVRFFSSSTLPRFRPTDNEGIKEAIEFEGLKSPTFQAGDIPYWKFSDPFDNVS